jgi:hypothetical protein
MKEVPLWFAPESRTILGSNRNLVRFVQTQLLWKGISMPRFWCRLTLAPILALAAALLLSPGLGLAIQLLANPGLNDPAAYVDTGRDWRDFDETVANGWGYYYVADGTYGSGDDAPKLHWMSSRQFAQAFGGLDYYREGDASQVIWSAYDTDAGIYQQVSGLTIGQDYAFEIAMASFWRGSGYQITDGKMVKCIGIDPYGGTDPTASTVIWDWDNCDSTDKTWPYLDMAATAQATAMTFFIRIQSPDNHSTNHTDLNYVFIDDGRLALAPTVNLVVPVTSDPSIDLGWTASTDPDWTLQGVEVQYKDHADGIWHVIQGNTDTDTSYVLQGQPGHIYTVRARAWQEQGNYDLHGLWVERQVQVGGVYAGYVRNNFGIGIGGAEVSIPGSTTSSELGGFYALQPPAYGQPYAITASANGYTSPLPISATVASDTSLTSITFTLKPTNDAIANGDFEVNTADWAASGTGSATLFSGDHRSGDASLKMTGPISLTQTAALSGVYNPTLSFWYSPALSGGNSLQVSLSQGGTVLASKVFTEDTASGWQHTWLAIDHAGQYAGALTVSFHATGGQVSLDEVSLGDGPRMIFLPVIFR